MKRRIFLSFLLCFFFTESADVRSYGGYFLAICKLCLRSVHTYSWFLKSNWSSHFVHAETESGTKKRVVLRREFFFAQKEKTVSEQKIYFSLVVFCSHAATSLWFLLFFLFFGSDFFLNGFRNPFMVHSRSSFLFEPNFDFSLVLFCSHAAFWHWFFVWLFSQWKFFELYVRTCPAMRFFTSSNRFLSRLTLTFAITSVTSTALQLKFVCVTSFLLLGRLRDLPH